MKFGYARVSTKEQNLDRQIKQLEEINCQVIYSDKLSGKNMERPEFQEMLSNLKPGDEIWVSDLTRVSRSTKDLFELVDIIKDKGATLHSLKDTWLDMSSKNPYSDFLFTVIAGVNQLERDLMKVRQAEGIAVARAKGIYIGRPRRYHKNHSGLNHAIELYKTGKYTVNEICEITKISRATFYRRMKEYEYDVLK